LIGDFVHAIGKLIEVIKHSLLENAIGGFESNSMFHGDFLSDFFWGKFFGIEGLEISKSFLLFRGLWETFIA
jgi:hypothetical protein